MRSLLVRAIAFGSFLTAALVVARAPAEEPVPADALAKIQAAAPDKATAKPAQPRKLLVYTGCKGFVHSSIPYVAAAIQEIGRKTGAFEVVASADPAVFKPESLQGFAGICLNNTTGELFDDPALKASLLQFVKDGKGLIGIHGLFRQLARVRRAARRVLRRAPVDGEGRRQVGRSHAPGQRRVRR